MDDERKIIIAFLFKRSGKTELKGSDLYLTLSLELGWFSSQQAKQFVEQALQEKNLEMKKNLITPTFDVTTVDIPVGFRPTKQTYESALTEKQDTTEPTKDEDVTTTIIDRISSHTGQSKKEILTTIQQIQKEKQIYPELAALLLAKKHNIAIIEFYDAVEQKILAE